MSWDEGGPAVQSVTPIVLAAGAGTRFRDVGHKLTAALPATARRPAEPVVIRAVAAARAADLGPVIVVTGMLDAADLGLTDEPASSDDAEVIIVHNDEWRAGQMTSVRAGLSIAERRGSSVAVVGLADQPGVQTSAWRAVAAAVDPTAAPIAVATYDGRRGNPVALHRTIWDQLPSGGDEGARSLMRLRPELVVEVPCSGSPTDIDTAEDLRRWQSS